MKLATLMMAIVIWLLIKYILKNENPNSGRARVFEQRG